MSPGFPTTQGIKGSEDNICPSQRAESIQAATMSPSPACCSDTSLLPVNCPLPSGFIAAFPSQKFFGFLPHYTLPSWLAMPRCSEEEHTSAWDTSSWTHTWQDAALLSPGSFWVTLGAASKVVPNFYSQHKIRTDLQCPDSSVLFLAFITKEMVG